MITDVEKRCIEALQLTIKELRMGAKNIKERQPLIIGMLSGIIGGLSQHYEITKEQLIRLIENSWED